MQPLRDEFEALWQGYINDRLAAAACGESVPGCDDAVADILRAPGKRLRPLLFIQACRMFGCEPIPRLVPAALALEMAHNFILVHDDVVDRSGRRRGKATLPAKLDALLAGHAAGGFRGSDMALVAGDLLYTLAMDTLMQAEAPAERVVAALRIFMRIAMETGRGALMEVSAAQLGPERLTLEKVERLYAMKTGRYTFELPLRLAAVFAGRGDDFPFGPFGEHAGIAFQLANDRKALVEWMADGPLPDDLRDGRPIWAVVQAWHAAEDAGRAVLAGEPGPAFQDVLRETGAMAAMDEAIRRHAREAMACRSDLMTDASMADLLLGTDNTGGRDSHERGSPP